MPQASVPSDNEFLAEKVTELAKRVEALEAWIQQNDWRLNPDYEVERSTRATD